MQRYARNTKIFGGVFLTVAILSFISFLVILFCLAHTPELAAPLAFLSFFMSASCFITYFVKFYWFGHTFKILQTSGCEHYLDDIDLANPTFRHSQIYCGKKAFFCKRTGSVVAYEQLAWIYCINGRNGEYTIRLKNGKKAYIMIGDAELYALLNNYVTPVTPKIIEGNTVHAKKEFFSLYPEAAAASANGRVIGGSSLIVLFLVFLTAALINDALDVGAFIVIGVIGAIGIGLLIHGLKGVNIVSVAASIHNRLSHSDVVNTVFKIGSVFAGVCLVLFFVSGALRIEPLLLPAVIGYGIGMVFFMGSIFLRTGFFNKEVPTFSVRIPEEMLDDTSFITAVLRERNHGMYTYTFRLTGGYGWDYMRDAVDHLFNCDIEQDSVRLSVGDVGTSTDITKGYLKSKKTGQIPLAWSREHGYASIFGKSKSLKCFISVFFYNQTQILKLSFPLENEKIAVAYAETIIRRSFGTPDQLKLAKPIPPMEPVTIDDNTIHVNSAAFASYLKAHPQNPMYEFRGVIPLTEKEPRISLYEDGAKTREYLLETEGDEDFTGKYFLISVRLGMLGTPAVPVAQIDGFISDTSEERQMTRDDIGYRMEGHFLACGGESGKQRYEMTRGQDLQMKGLKYQGYTTPSNIRLMGVCPDCGKSFCFHGYAFYMVQNDVAYSDDGLDCCEIAAYDIDKENWSYETEGKVFRYYNSFHCPHCGTPYIDYKKHPENKVLGVSGCVLLGKKCYQFK